MRTNQVGICYIDAMGKEYENSDRQGKVMISISDWVPKGNFSLCTKEGDTLLNLYTGPFSELGGSYFANGEARMCVQSGIDVYYVFNPGDIKDAETRKKILPENINLDNLG
ncbi:MAG: hypothetical protein UW64_C0023G0032 [Microgenomates group bacterium GW2011_GWC1_44_37]|uniref:Uncharacterized protein n=1 Tax=Candidatus Collierbacteria bacterium GW2011_GWB2_44_22 TaxID=1618387 RepID=A0A0G1HXW2_9BACT|nr:MAG: hypothetical protein UW44_C0008G0102 [Candidatus Collierbacteria bacterium GW2011_GWB2_44_22]KKT68316.1 MAG: hypothetical protein UW64_C0023G0032 [Microgenomates group bacterium GW2011_GWC1_44_37]